MQIFFSAGEPSGDEHAAHLIQELRRRNPTISMCGFGGPEMAAAGCSLLFELTQLAVMGFLRVIPLLARFRQLVIQAERRFDESPPDAVVLVDFPGFNWWIARAAKKRGIPVFYYLPPQLWAWAPWRISRVRRWVDHVICALPFEYDWYAERGVAATWVGHPFFDEVAAETPDAALVDDIRGSASGRPVIAVLPGSRGHEVDKNFPVMLEVMKRVSAEVPGVRWVVGNYRDEHRGKCQELQNQCQAVSDITYYVGRTSECIEAADCCLMVSGSISLELLARHKPGIVLYRVPRIGRLASRVLMTCRYITLTNLIAGWDVMPEFISCGSPENDIRRMTDCLTRWCADPVSLQNRVADIKALAEKYAVTGATTRTADLLLQQLMADNAIQEIRAA
ncbi:MAG: lipid-A-disaccharide synthase [Planctomycetaceae bacterium]|nr:lipid-A-disaccharide synthase [Planctomycetaceae bacterium]